MNTRFIAARAPAVSMQEATLLPAMDRETPSALPRNLYMPARDLVFRPMPPVEAEERNADNLPRRRGSMAGRAVLAAVSGRRFASRK